MVGADSTACQARTCSVEYAPCRQQEPSSDSGNSSLLSSSRHQTHAILNNIKVLYFPILSDFIKIYFKIEQERLSEQTTE